MSGFLLLILLYEVSPGVAGCLCGVSEGAGLSVCDVLENRIAGGRVAEVNEFPWAALLEIKAGGTPLRCGGSLVNDR